MEADIQGQGRWRGAVIPVHDKNGVTIYHSHSIFALLSMPDNSVDSIVTDPPYGLKFMGKKWDYDVPSVQLWHEALRVLKPGGHLLSFAGSRTYHRMAVNIEDAGFEIRDQIMWIYGSGFPKSLDISKAIDKASGVEREDKYEGGMTQGNAGATGNKKCDKCGKWLVSGNPCKCPRPQDVPQTPDAIKWDGWGTALKPAHEPIVVARKPISGTVAENVLKHGTGGINIDGGRIEGTDKEILQGSTVRNNIKGGNYASGHKPNDGTIPDYVQNPKGRFPANIILDPEAGAMLDKQSGELTSGALTAEQQINGGFKGALNCYGDAEKGGESNFNANSGGASRFFKRVDLDCPLCYNTYTKDINKESDLWQQLFVSNAEKNSRDSQAIIKNIALLNVTQKVSEKLVQNVKSAGSLCDLCAISIAHALVAIKNSDSKTGELQAILDYIGSCKSSILIQNLVNFAELWESIGTIPTTKSLSILFGSVHHAIRNYTPKTKKSEQARFKYTPKASKQDRDEGMEGFLKKTAGECTDRQEGTDGLNSPRAGAGRTDGAKNHHPTVKPTSLMQYLVRLVTPPGGMVLDPFMGSGSTGKGAVREGFKFIGCEREAEYIPIAIARINAPAQVELL